MMKIFRSLRDIDFGKLMLVYEEGNLENAREFYPKMEINLGVLNVEQDFYRYLETVFFTTEGSFYAVWELEGRFVSALRMEPFCDGLLLEALETAPDQRRKGYAAALIKAVLGYLKEHNNCVVYAHVSKRNEASLRTHTSCGFKRTLEHAVYIDGSVKHNACTLRFVVK